ncbi:MAG TPA: VOC family protein [Gemmatimonadales bacterium]|jgi:methylmalonyl-CoA/ethylmalonyl-CoA epimerase|nr:VOC family protein [Gemmatimonadales bacterium]
MTHAPSSLGSLGQIGIPVRSVPAAAGFYRAQLGLPFLFEVPGMAFFDAGGVRLMLSGPEVGAVGPAGAVLYFKVADIEATHDELVRRGVEFVQRPHVVAELPDHDLWLAFFRDPSENLLALMSEVPR